MFTWLARSPFASALRTFAAVLLAALIADWTSAGSLAFDRWQTWIIAALSSAVPVIIRALNPADNAFGLGSLRARMSAQDVAADALVQATPGEGVGSSADSASAAAPAPAVPVAAVPVAAVPVAASDVVAQPVAASAVVAQPVAVPQPVAPVSVPQPSRTPRRSLTAMVLLAVGNLLLMGGTAALTAYWTTSTSTAWREIVPLMAPPLLVLVLIVLSQTAQRLRFVLQSAAVVVSLYIAGPTIIVWMTYLRASESSTVRPLILTSVLLTFLGALVSVAAVVTFAVQLRRPLLAPANRASYQVDTTSLIALLAVAAVIIVRGTLDSLGSFVVITDPAASLIAEPGSVSAITIMLGWVIPVILWTAFTVRRGGAMALGTAIGLVTAFAIIPLLLPIIGRLLGAVDAAQFTDTWTPAGSNALLAILAAVLLVIVIIWNAGLDQHSPPPAARPVAGAPVNSLSVVAFCLAWIPVTSIVSIVLGHIAYDQIVANPGQRGIGLARWSIALGYVIPMSVVLYFYLRA